MIKKIVAVLVIAFSTTTYAHDFNWDNLMLSDAKLNPSFDYEVYVDAYMQRYRKPVWNKYKNDEFELEGKREETIEMMKKRFEAFDLTQEFVINTSSKFGKYDFKNQEFPLEGISASSYFNTTKQWRIENVFPYRYKVFFTNANIMKNLPMEKTEAKAFIQNKKSSSGRVDRRLPTTVKFKIERKRGKDEFDALVTEVTVYDSKKNTVLITFK